MIEKHVDNLVEHLEPFQAVNGFYIFLKTLLREDRENPFAGSSERKVYPGRVRQRLREHVDAGLLQCYHNERAVLKGSMVETLYLKAG